MNVKSPHFIALLVLATLVAGGVLTQQLLAQNAETRFSQSLGFLVHNENKDTELTWNRAIELLKSSTGNDPCDSVWICPMESDERNKTIPLQEFLVGYFDAELPTLMPTLRATYPKVEPDGQRAWLHARRQNWLKDGPLNYLSVRDFLYRFNVSKRFGGLAYFYGLTLSVDEITPAEFPSLNQVEKARQDLEALWKNWSGSPKGDTALKKAIQENLQAFRALETNLREAKHPFNRIPSLPEPLRDQIEALGLQEVLAELHYDYSGNAAYRQRNLKTGVLKLNSKLYQPGESMDFLQVLSADAWRGIGSGWTVVGGMPVWEFGGGLCGASTMISIPAWQAGLEMVNWYPHRIFYNNLYPNEFIGLDATIYRPNKTLKVRNNTDHPILYYVEDRPEEQSIGIYIIGNSPYQRLEFEGPIQIDKRTFKWVRHMERHDGTIMREERITRYDSIR